MKELMLGLLLGLAVFAVGCTSTESYVQQGYNFGQLSKVAVVDVYGDIRGDMAKNQIGDFVTGQLMRKGYTVIERAQVQTLLEEQQFQAGEITSVEGAARAGEILNVPAVIIVNIATKGEDMTISAKMVEVETGAILWLGTGSGSTGKTLSTIAGAALGAGVGVAVTGDDDQLIGGIVGGVLGGVAGRALAPQTAEKAQEIICKITEALPQRF